MVMSWIRLMGGVVTIRVRGAEPERFLNACMCNGIRLHGIRRQDIDELTARLSVRDFFRLRGCMRRTHCRVHVIRRSGLPFAVRRLRGRYALWTSALLLFAVLYVLSTRIWVIETSFPEGVDGYAVMRELESMGIRAGTPVKSIDRQAVKIHMMQKFDFLSFFSINFEGNCMQIETGAAISRLEQENEQAITSVIAEKSGLVTQVDAWRGDPIVKVGDVVLAGDRLVDAVVQPTAELGQPRLVAAEADIWARTWKKGERILSCRTRTKHYSGNVHTRYALVIGKTRINLYSNSGISMGSCDKIETTTQFRLSSTVRLPISLVKQTLYFYEESESVYSEETAKQLLEYGALRRINSGMSEGSVEEFEGQTTYRKDAAVLSWRAECLEQIGVAVSDGRTQEEILPDEQEENAQSETE
ncbi:MAG: sporulation protein YqfD [Butyricicoccaceae bacterium]